MQAYKEPPKATKEAESTARKDGNRGSQKPVGLTVKCVRRNGSRYGEWAVVGRVR